MAAPYEGSMCLGSYDVFRTDRQLTDKQQKILELLEKGPLRTYEIVRELHGPGSLVNKRYGPNIARCLRSLQKCGFVSAKRVNEGGRNLEYSLAICEE